MKKQLLIILFLIQLTSLPGCGLYDAGCPFGIVGQGCDREPGDPVRT